MTPGEVDLPCGMALGKPDSLECIVYAYDVDMKSV